MTVCTVLVVDDDESVRGSIAAMLSSLRHDVIQARDGLEALSVYKSMSVKISIVLMNIRMARIDGIEATRLIKKFNSHAKIILISGYTQKIPPNVQPSAFLAGSFTRLELGDIVQLVLKSAS